MSHLSVFLHFAFKSLWGAQCTLHIVKNTGLTAANSWNWQETADRLYEDTLQGSLCFPAQQFIRSLCLAGIAYEQPGYRCSWQTF